VKKWLKYFLYTYILKGKVNMSAEKGITFVSLVITIIVLLILVGVTIMFGSSTIIQKADLASNKTFEAKLTEKIELAWTEYLLEKEDKLNDTKLDFQTILSKYLEQDEIIKEINIDEISFLKIAYKQEEFGFSISQEGKVSSGVLLKSNVKVGDYISYSFEYDDVYSNQHYTNLTGWRVIDDGVMNGTSGEVRIISTGIPAKWYYDSYFTYNDNEEAIADLVNNFENIDLQLSSKQKIKGSKFKDESIANKITTLTLKDFNCAYNAINQTNRLHDDVTNIENNNDLLYFSNPQTYYWLATSNKDVVKNIYYINVGKVYDTDEMRVGIRPVISLKINLTGNKESGIWKINN